MAKRRTPNASVSEEKRRKDRTTKARESVEKGRRFEDRVADLYRLLGAQVTQNIYIIHKKVDILAKFPVPGSNQEHRVIIECKDEKTPVDANTRVQAFKGLLDLARETRKADSAEIITRVPWSDYAKGFANDAGIGLCTYTEKLSQLIDFRAYLKQLIRNFEEGDAGRPTEPPLGAYYVDLSGEKTLEGKTKRVPIIDTYIYEWLKGADTSKQLAIFGEYGMGKSSLCEKIARDVASAFLKDPNAGRIPILLNLRAFIGKVKIDAFITSFLDQECGVQNPKYALFKAMNDAGVFLLIFDGFDEMAVKVDVDTLESNLAEIDKLASSAKTKAILTSRPEHFITTEEENQALTPAVNPLRIRGADYKLVRILPWDDRQVEMFLKKRIPLIKEVKQSWQFYRDHIKRLPSLSEISQRPVLLDMIVKTLPKMIEDNLSIDLPSLYKTYISGEIKRQKIAKQREFLLTENARLALLEELGIETYANTISAVTYSEALARIERHINPPVQERDAYTREFLTNSFLVRKGNEYYFSHKSIMEYLVAKKFAQEVQSKKPDAFGRLIVRQEILRFLGELKSHTKTLWNWLNSAPTLPAGTETYLAANSATLLCAFAKDALTGKDLSGKNLTGANLSFADLRGINFRQCLLKDVNLNGAQYLEEEIAHAQLANVTITASFLKERNSLSDKQLNSFFHFVDDQLRFTGISNVYGGAKTLVTVRCRILDGKGFKILKALLLRLFRATAAIFADESARLVKHHPQGIIWP